LIREKSDDKLEVLRKHVEKGLPCGADGFVKYQDGKLVEC